MQLDYVLLWEACGLSYKASKAQSFDNGTIVAAPTMDFDTVYGPGKMVGAGISPG